MWSQKSTLKHLAGQRHVAGASAFASPFAQEKPLWNLGAEKVFTVSL